jgi:alkanesulfonate monooxygenase SsuD/methylene tetrahydromethanopterin reductase-like flavin-dependent oxidoreductase (luciferase family)
MVEGLHIIRGLWGEGEFSYNGSYYTISGLDGTPKPVQQPHPPIFIGGSGPRILAVAAREADIVGVLPTPLPRGGHNWVGSTDEVLAERVGWVREAAGECFDRLELSGIAFRAIPTERPATVAAELATEYGLTPEQLLASPDFLIGSETEMVEQLLERRARFAISYVEIPERDTAAFAPVVARLAGH